MTSKREAARNVEEGSGAKCTKTVPRSSATGVNEFIVVVSLCTNAMYKNCFV